MGEVLDRDGATNIDRFAALWADRSKWGSGPWDTEPDRLEWRTAAGLPALLVRSPHMGAWCGYVAVPPGHWAHGVDWENIQLEDSVHGGLTYSDACAGRICHVPPPGEPDDVWWLGFDASHAFDVSPGLSHMAALAGLSMPPQGTYRDVAYMKAECESLATQLAARFVGHDSNP